MSPWSAPYRCLTTRETSRVARFGLYRNLRVSLPHDPLRALRNRHRRPLANLRMERLPAPRVGPGGVVVDQRLAQLLLARNHQLAMRRLPALVQSRVQQVPAIEITALGRSLCVGIAA